MNENQSESELTLRDIFALSITNGLAKNYSVCTGYSKNIENIMLKDAHIAYKFADAMLKVRDELSK